MSVIDITTAQYFNNEMTGEQAGIQVTYTDGNQISVPIEPKLALYQKIMEYVADGDLTIAAAPDEEE